MSVIPQCPRCGSRMEPSPLEDAGQTVGTCWKCLERSGGCGFQMPVYRDGYIEDLEAAEERRHIMEQEAELAAHPDRWDVYDAGGMVGSFPTKAEAVAAMEAVRDGRLVLRCWALYNHDYESEWIL